MTRRIFEAGAFYKISPGDERNCERERIRQLGLRIEREWRQKARSGQ
jgi:hypothetical protein